MKISVALSTLSTVQLPDKCRVFYLDDEFGIWYSARYFSKRPCGNHKIVFYFRKDRTDKENNFGDKIVPLSEIFVLNILNQEYLDPLAFAESRYTDTLHFHRRRKKYISSHASQRAAFRSISAIPGSSIELEPHQLAVVKVPRLYISQSSLNQLDPRSLLSILRNTFLISFIEAQGLFFMAFDLITSFRPMVEELLHKPR